MHIRKRHYEMTLLPTGQITRLTNGADDINIVKKDKGRFGIPFEKGTQKNAKYVPFNQYKAKGDQWVFTGKNSKLIYEFSQEHFNFRLQFHEIKGPRQGIQCDFNFLDSDLQGPEDKLMLTDFYIDQQTMYAYFLFRRFDGKYVVMTVNQPFAAYRLLYSYFGHKVVGMQLLICVTDLWMTEQQNIKMTDVLDVTIAFCDDLTTAKQKAADLLGISLVTFSLSGNVVYN